MFKFLASTLTLSALLAVPTASHAVIYTFNAALSGANEVLTAAPGGPGSGNAVLNYDDKGTLALTDDTYNFSMSVFGLTGGTSAGTTGTAASMFHIHGPATTAQNSGVMVGLDNPALFTFLNSGSTLLVGGSNVVAPTGLFSGPSFQMSFLTALRSSLAYVNVHTFLNPQGAVRGQLIEVTAVPEPSTYAMLLAGLGVVGLVARRRRASQT